MNRQEYMQELYQRLGPLPLTADDVNNAMRYYEEYFDKAGPEREQEVIKELGSPAYVAAQVALKLSGSLVNAPGEKKTIGKNINVLWLAIIGIFAAPVALPLAFAAVATIGSLLFAALCTIAGFGLGGIICTAVGAAVTVYSFTFLFIDFTTALYFMGSGLVTLVGGIFLTRFGWWLCGLIIKGAKKIGSFIFSKINKEEVAHYAQ